MKGYWSPETSPTGRAHQPYHLLPGGAVRAEMSCWSPKENISLKAPDTILTLLMHVMNEWITGKGLQSHISIYTHTGNSFISWPPIWQVSVKKTDPNIQYTYKSTQGRALLTWSRASQPGCPDAQVQEFWGIAAGGPVSKHGPCLVTQRQSQPLSHCVIQMLSFVWYGFLWRGGRQTTVWETFIKAQVCVWGLYLII